MHNNTLPSEAYIYPPLYIVTLCRAAARLLSITISTKNIQFFFYLHSFLALIKPVGSAAVTIRHNVRNYHSQFYYFIYIAERRTSTLMCNIVQHTHRCKYIILKSFIKHDLIISSYIFITWRCIPT